MHDCIERALRPRALGSAIDFSPISDFDDEDFGHVVLDTADDAVLPHPVFPERRKPRTFQGFSDTARIIQMRNPFEQKPQDSFSVLTIKLSQLPLCGGV